MISFSKALLFTVALLGQKRRNNAVHAACQDATTCSACFQETGQHPAGCTWFEDIDFCEDGCGMDGCGAAKCASEITTCAECLGQSMHKQYAWSPTDNKCHASCMDAPADGACFPGSTYGPEVCQPMKCGDATNCGDCMNAQGDHPAGCTWFADIGYCEDGCQMNGCGASKCASEITTCGECLGQSMHKQYAWSPDANKCFESCMDAPADGACFPGSTYGPEVCGECRGNGISCNKCMSSASKCAWTPTTNECVDDCSQAPADGACFPRPTYGQEICSSSTGFSASDANGTDTTTSAAAPNRRGRLLSSVVTLCLLVAAAAFGQVFSSGNY